MALHAGGPGASGGRPAANDLKVFVPAKDFALSKRFYAALVS